MKKTRTGFLALLSVGALLLSMAGCTARLDQTELKAAYETAVKNSMKADLYFWKENKINGKQTSYREANVFVPQDKHYESVRDEKGEYQQVLIKVSETVNQKTALEYLCGLSKPEAQGGNEKAYLFKNVFQDGKSIAKTKTPMTGKEFYASETFRPYTLQANLAELEELTVDDMDFSIKGGTCEKQVNVTSLIFGIKEDYLKRYEAKHGKPSRFAGTKKVSIELAYERISHVITYMDEVVEQGIAVETENYKFEVVYLGPKLSMPVYDAKGEKGEMMWKDA